jgi:hypothetical protein
MQVEEEVVLVLDLEQEPVELNLEGMEPMQGTLQEKQGEMVSTLLEEVVVEEQAQLLFHLLEEMEVVELSF